MKKYFLPALIFASLITSCFAKDTGGFKSVSMEEGLKLMKNDSDYVLLDVRTSPEYNAGHIPGAILHTNELINQENTESLLKDKNQNIYVYCRSGRRSKLACGKLAQYGYKNIIEIGGIIDYKGIIER